MFILGPSPADIKKAMSGHAIPIVVTTEDHAFKLDEPAISKILLRNDIRDRNVVVISVAGAFRKGKSFLLDFFLRYLYSKVKTTILTS